MTTINARYIRSARVTHQCECGRRIPPRSPYLALYGHADDGTPPFRVAVCPACIREDFLPAVEAQQGYAWRDERTREAVLCAKADGVVTP
jgi:hypothetical protein